MQWQTRYARQMALTGWDKEGQERLARRSVLIIGLGGLGSPVATYLATAGTGRLVLNDFDHVDLSNLPRQPLYSDDDVDHKKTHSASHSLKKLNPYVHIETIDQRMNPTMLETEMRSVDCVVDCSDNFGTRFNVNCAAVASKTPLVSAAAIRHQGQVVVFRNDLKSSPCYRCLYEESDESIEDCQGQGVLTPLVGVVGCLAATAVLNLLVYDKKECGLLHCFDAREFHWRTLTLKKDPLCPVCS